MLGWSQHVNTFTRYREGQQPGLLDLVISNEVNVVEILKFMHFLKK